MTHSLHERNKIWIFLCNLFVNSRYRLQTLFISWTASTLLSCYFPLRLDSIYADRPITSPDQVDMSRVILSVVFQRGM